MIILGIDSAAAGCAACVWKDGAVLACADEAMTRGQDARLVPLVQEVMAQAGVGYEALDRIAVTRGPGSFTGLRVGLAAARAFGLGAGKPVIGIDRFAIFARAAKEAGALTGVLTLLDSRRAELFVRMDGVQTGVPMLLDPRGIAALTVPEGMRIYADAGAMKVAHEIFGARALALAEPEIRIGAALAAEASEKDPAFAPEPLYLRPPDVTLSKKGRPL